MPDDKRTRQMRQSAPPPLTGRAADGEVDPALEDTVAPDISTGETLADQNPVTPAPGGAPIDPADPSLARGESVGRYVVLDLLGEGGMGEVYTAYDPELDRRVALKVIHAAVRAGGDPDAARARLLREAQTLAKLSHPNVVAVYDVGELEDSGDVYVAMEYVEGSDLRGWLEVKDRGLEEIVAVFIDVAQGLAAAHDVGLVHRDVKPDNILIGDDGRVRVIDFGIAHAAERKRDRDELVAKLAETTGEKRKLSLTESDGGTLIGTPAYMTPEQFLGSSAGGKSDQFSLCVALYEAVSGHRPFPGKTLPELSANVLDNKRQALTVGAEVPRWLTDALEIGLAPEPEDRHEDMRVLAAALVPPEPRRHLAIWLVAASVLGAIGIGAAYMMGGASAKAETCANAADGIADVWNDEKKAAIKSAFAGANAPHGNAAFLRTRDVLDKYAVAWTGARIKACRESAARELTEATVEKKLACLEGGLRELRAVTTVLLTADSDLIEEAVNIASSITAVSTCSNLTRLIATPILPAELDSSIATIKTLERAGRYEAGLREAKSALTRAGEMASELARARLLVWRGRLESQQGRSEAAIESLFEGIRVAEVVGDTFSRAQAWTYVVFVAGVKQRERLAALRWAKHAEIAIKQDGTPLTLESKRLQHVAQVKRGLRRYDDALVEFRRAIGFAEQAYGNGSYESLIAKMGTAITLRRLSRLDESVAMYREVIGGMTELLGPENPKLAPVYSNLGVVLVELKRYDEGREAYQRSLELKRTKLGPEHHSVLITEINMAVLEERLGNFEAARVGIERIHEIRLKRFGDNYPQLPSTLESRASLAAKLGKLAEAAAFARRSGDLYRARGDDALESAAWADVTLCNILRLQRKLGEARRKCGGAIKSLRAKGEDPRTLASALSYAAHVELDAGRPKVALTFAEEAAQIRSEHESKPSNVAHTHMVHARALRADPSEATQADKIAKLAKAALVTLHKGDRHLLAPDIEDL